MQVLKIIPVRRQTWPPSAIFDYSCYRISSETTGRIRIKTWLMFASISSCASTKTNLVYQKIWPFGSRLRLSEISHLQACYRISSKIAGQIFEKKNVRIFLSVTSCASTEKHSGPWTNMAAFGLMDFSCDFKKSILKLFYSRFSICNFPLMDIKIAWLVSSCL